MGFLPASCLLPPACLSLKGGGGPVMETMSPVPRCRMPSSVGSTVLWGYLPRQHPTWEWTRRVFCTVGCLRQKHCPSVSFTAAFVRPPAVALCGGGELQGVTRAASARAAATQVGTGGTEQAQGKQCLSNVAGS